MANIPIGLQLYSVREDCAKDLPGTLKAVARMGYQGVEFAGYYGYSAEDLRKMLDDLGLKCCGTHTGIDTVLGDEIEKTMDFNQTLGNIYLIVPGLPGQYTATIGDWLQTANLFNEISEKARKRGFYVGYHNHHTEFHEIEGSRPWDVFFNHTHPDVVMQIDIGNALVGGARAVDYIDRFAGRARTVHLKEHAAGNDKALVGEGDVDWDEVFRACETVGGTKWYIVEQESYAYPPLECVEKCLQNLRKMGK